MKVIITGGLGMIGRALAKDLARDGHEVTILTRRAMAGDALDPGIRLERWDGRTAEGWGSLADGAGAIVNLAGENLSAGRWTAARKQAILRSRVESGAAVADAILKARQKPRLLIQSSAVGYYGPAGDELLGEQTDSGTDFLASVCRDWEESTRLVEAHGVRRAVVRTGVVLSRGAGALPRMLLPFRLFAGGPLGSGRQWMSWIHLEDSVRALRFLMDSSDASGPFNLSATPLTNREFTRTVSKVMRRPGFFRVPSWLVRVAFGEMGTVVLDGQRVSSQRLEGLGFTFRFPDAESALRDLLRRPAAQAAPARR